MIFSDKNKIAYYKNSKDDACNAVGCSECQVDSAEIVVFYNEVLVNQ
jgi:hypothetical protein